MPSATFTFFLPRTLFLFLTPRRESLHPCSVTIKMSLVTEETDREQNRKKLGISYHFIVGASVS